MSLQSEKMLSLADACRENLKKSCWEMIQSNNGITERIRPMRDILKSNIQFARAAAWLKIKTRHLCSVKRFVLLKPIIKDQG